MSFEVRPPALKTFAGALDTLSTASFVAVGYADHTKPEASGGSAFVRFLNATADVRPSVVALFEHLKTLSDASADEMVDVARYYETTDQASAAETDKTYDQVQSAPTGSNHPNGPR